MDSSDGCMGVLCIAILAGLFGWWIRGPINTIEHETALRALGATHPITVEYMRDSKPTVAMREWYFGKEASEQGGPSDG